MIREVARLDEAHRSWVLQRRPGATWLLPDEARSRLALAFAPGERLIGVARSWVWEPGERYLAGLVSGDPDVVLALVDQQIAWMREEGGQRLTASSVEGKETARLLRAGFAIHGVDGGRVSLEHPMSPMDRVVPAELAVDPRPWRVVQGTRREVGASLWANARRVMREVFRETPFSWDDRWRGWLAVLDDEVVGAKFGSSHGPTLYSHLGGVPPRWRRRGIARALMRAQHAWAGQRGLRWITTDTQNRFRSMILLNLSAGFVIDRVSRRRSERVIRMKCRL